MLPVVAALGADGFPVGWVDAPLTQRELVFEAEPAGPCAPCPADAQCSPCPPPFHRFASSDADGAEGKMVFVAFKVPPGELPKGEMFRLSGRMVKWPPYGVVFITTDSHLKPWFSKHRCEQLAAEYVALRDASRGPCVENADCTILSGGVDDCGRAIDRETAEKLEDSYSLFRAKCGLNLHCAPRMARAVCRGGHCKEETIRKPVP